MLKDKSSVPTVPISYPGHGKLSAGVDVDTDCAGQPYISRSEVTPCAARASKNICRSCSDTIGKYAELSASAGIFRPPL